jgi:hydrogenase expression/formation protein HypC
MCLAIPAKVLSLQGEMAQVDFGGGVHRDVNVTLVDVHVGEYVLVHTGYAIEVLDPKAAQETLQLWRDLLAFGEEEPTS